MRRTVVRHTVLTIIETLRAISSKVHCCLHWLFRYHLHFTLQVKKRFPTYDHLVEAGVITSREVKALERAQGMTDYSCYWVPITWASSLTQQAWQQGYIKKAKFLVSVNKEMACVKGKCGEVFSYTFICFPLVYTQVKCSPIFSCAATLYSNPFFFSFLFFFFVCENLIKTEQTKFDKTKPTKLSQN